MRVFLTFFLGLAIGVAGSVLTHKWKSTKKKKAFYAFPRLRSPSRSIDNQRSSKKVKKISWPVLATSLVTVITILIFFVMIPNTFNSKNHSKVRKSLPQNIASYPLPGASLGSLVKKDVTPPGSGAGTADMPHKPSGKSRENNISYPYSLKLGSYISVVRAKKAMRYFAKMGLSTYWVKVDLKKKGVWYRVFAGYFTKSEQGERFRQKHGLKTSRVKKTRFANLIGVFTSPKALEDKVQGLKDLGYSPYVIRDPDGKSRLFVGAFLSRKGARDLYNDLKSARIESQIVLR